MILQITPDISRVAVRIRNWTNQRYLADWEHIQLVIEPGQRDGSCCHQGGSPWYLHGCWPGKLVGVDVGNPPRPDFPAFCIPAFERDSHGRIVFILPERWKMVPPGRYTGLVRYAPASDIPVNIWQYLHRPKEDERPVFPEGLGSYSCVPQEHIEPKPKFECHTCILAQFDIDYGPRCSDHIIDQAALEFSLSTCEEDV